MLSDRKAVVAMQVEGKTKFNQSVSAKASPMRIGEGGVLWLVSARGLGKVGSDSQALALSPRAVSGRVCLDGWYRTPIASHLFGRPIR